MKVYLASQRLKPCAKCGEETAFREADLIQEQDGPPFANVLITLDDGSRLKGAKTADAICVFCQRKEQRA